MAVASQQDIERWFKKGVAENATHMLVVCDTYDHNDYPVYVTVEEKIREKEEEFSKNMQKVMEVYDLRKDMKEQTRVTHRVFNY